MTQDDKDLQLLKEDFVAFLFVLWAALGLPEPTRIQIQMARDLQYQRSSRFIIQGFRGVAKSWITCAFAVWCMWNNPQLNIEIVSANATKAAENSKFIKDIIALLPFLHHLKPRRGQRDTVEMFDVGPAKPNPSPSFKAVGITGQITGSRADIIIADDVEIPSNSATQAMRDKLSESVKEFAAILKSAKSNPNVRIIYLGTPQCEMTLYKTLEVDRGYSTIIYPIRYPRTQKELSQYGERLSKILRDDLEANPDLMGQPTDPERFDEDEIQARELEYGKSGFLLQFMLNPDLSDAEKYPLRLKDLIVCALGIDEAPLNFIWLPNRRNQLSDDVAPNVGLRGDSIHTYESCSTTFGAYQSRILVIDPSGRGKDETGWCILNTLNGYIFGMTGGGLKGGYKTENLELLADYAKAYKVTDVVIEGNFGDGMFTELLKPVLLAKHRCAVCEVSSKGQKEKRIADVLEPLMMSHKLVINEDWFRSDFDTAVDEDGKFAPMYSLFHQMTRLTRDRGSLRHDDRLDALAIGCTWVVDQMAQDSAQGEKERIEDWLEEQMDFEGRFKTTVTPINMNGVEVLLHSDFGDDSEGLGFSQLDNLW